MREFTIQATFVVQEGDHDQLGLHQLISAVNSQNGSGEATVFPENTTSDVHSIHKKTSGEGLFSIPTTQLVEAIYHCLATGVVQSVKIRPKTASGLR